ncbi:MAG: hypothetical protein QNJ54_06935 [Prochloraceae cyanobacterium]|nr:hypothetical protein [Prochloraceae cyanobacterium]
MKRLSIVLFVFVFTIVVASPVQAQMADVPNFDSFGNFRSAFVMGNAGRYQHRQWLVVDTDSAGLNCRDSRNNVILTLSYGSVIDSVFDRPRSDAITVRSGQPWLKAEVSLLDVQRRITDEIAETYICYVRANTKYIAPINLDSQLNRVN